MTRTHDLVPASLRVGTRLESTGYCARLFPAESFHSSTQSPVASVTQRWTCAQARLLIYVLSNFKPFQDWLTRTVLISNLVKEMTVFTPLNLTICQPLTCFVTKQQPVGGGQCSRRDWTARLIFSLTGAITKLVSVIWMVNFGSDWTKSTAWPQMITACCVWTWKTLKGILLMPSITSFVLWVRITSTNWSSALTQVGRFVFFKLDKQCTAQTVQFWQLNFNRNRSNSNFNL